MFDTFYLKKIFNIKTSSFRNCCPLTLAIKGGGGGGLPILKCFYLVIYRLSLEDYIFLNLKTEYSVLFVVSLALKTVQPFVSFFFSQ